MAKLGSFAAAAVDLHVTHWAVGKQIRLLEDWFGVPLFERRARGVTLTDEGAALLTDVSEAFDRLAASATRLQVREPIRKISGNVRVNALASFALCWLIPKLAEFNSRYPDVDVRLSTTSRKLRYVGDAFDIGLRAGMEPGVGPMARVLMADERLPACSPDLLRRRPIRAVDDLRHHTLLHSASTRAAWSHWLRQAGAPGLKPVRQLEFDHSYLHLNAAVEGLGVTLASLPLIERDLAQGRLVCPIPAPRWRAPDYVLIINSDRAKDDAVIAFEQWIMSAANPGQYSIGAPAASTSGP